MTGFEIIAIVASVVGVVAGLGSATAAYLELRRRNK